MTSEILSQNGHKIDCGALIPEAKVYFYKPPSQADTLARGRKTKHLDHYVGTAIIVRQVGSRSFIIQYTDKKGVKRTYQRDAAMLSLVPPAKVIKDLSEPCMVIKSPHNHRSLEASPIAEGEVVILKDGADSTSWYCAKILEKLLDRIKVSYYTTEMESLVNFSKTTFDEKRSCLGKVIFRKTWSLQDGSATTISPEISKRRSSLWTGQIPINFLGEQLLGMLACHRKESWMTRPWIWPRN
jgi:hypothetical protein